MSAINHPQLIHQVKDARERTLQLVDGLTEEQMLGPRLKTVNPLRWEMAHAAYFYEFWILRNYFKEQPKLTNADQLFNSIDIPHEKRWELPLPSLEKTYEYMHEVYQATLKHLSYAKDDGERDYLTQYAVYHEDMHCEAFSYTRQTLAYPTPNIGVDKDDSWQAGGLEGDVQIPGGEFCLGASREEEFVFDNEKWAHVVEVKPFRIGRAAVSNLEYLKFVEQDGYSCREYWDEDGWEWRKQRNLEQPLYWRRNRVADWEYRHFDHWLPLPPDAAVAHISWYEASAYCRWAERRLPTELEWEVAAAGVPNQDGHALSSTKRRYPWGESPPSPDRANLDGGALGTIDVGALPNGDSAFGCRQMIGNVWEWTDTLFGPYPGFTPDMYQDYSQPLFGITRVLRGGAWATRARMIRNTFRTYYGPDRNDVFAGFRTCAL